MPSAYYRVPGPPGHYPPDSPLQPNLSMGEPPLGQYAPAPLPPAIPPHSEIPANPQQSSVEDDKGTQIIFHLVT